MSAGTKEKDNADYENGFLKYDVFPQNSFASRGLEPPKFGRVHEVRGSSSLVRALAWNCDGRKVASGSEYSGLRIHDVLAHPRAKDGTPTPHGTEVRDRPVSLPSSGKSPHHGHVAALAWSPTDPRILVSGCKSTSGGVVCVWDITAPSAPAAMFKISGDVLHVAFHPSGRQFAAVCPRSTRDEVFFYWLVRGDSGEKWEQRSDIVMGGAGIDIGVEEVNALRFWPGGDAVLAVSNDGSLNSWKYPVEERPALVDPALVDERPDERPAKRSRIATPESAPDTPDPEGKASRETPEDDREGEADKAEGEGEDGEGRATPAPAEVVEATVEGAAEEAEAEGYEVPAGDGMDATAKDETAGDADGDVQMGSASPTKANGTGAPPTPADTPAATAPPTAAPSRQATPPAATPAAEDKALASEKAAQEAAAKQAAAKAAAAAELERRKHRQLEKGFRQVIHVASLLALAVDPLGRFFALGGNDARVTLIDTADWIVQRNFDQPTGAIRQAAFSPDGEFLAVAGDDPFIYVLAVFARTVVAKFPVNPTVNALAWHPTRNTLAWSSNAKPGMVWYYASQE
ncbi:hypothetical protein Q8F55_003781 [Vanrija albida]|uniref:Anaphase-promoting complex subunit 4 WD40 domain-containing protein n=1 Tax=Vanrija albida TaxID=181172 RepID=A0ABR3Q4X4_9TREE